MLWHKPLPVTGDANLQPNPAQLTADITILQWGEPAVHSPGISMHSKDVEASTAQEAESKQSASKGAPFKHIQWTTFRIYIMCNNTSVS